MTSNSPTCVLSGGLCLQGVPTISSEVENSTFYCERCLYLQDPSSGSPGSAPGQCCPVTGGVLPAIMTTQDRTDEDHLLDPRQHHHQPAHSSSCATPPLQQLHHSTSNPSTPTCKSSKSGKSSGWKTSKFFSKTMSSGEILRGLKKLSLSGSSAAEPEWESPPPRPRKSKSGQLKKRSSYGNDEVATVDVEALAFGATQRSVVAAAVPVLNKAMSLSESGGPRPSNPGIVCKKEDLKAILCSATSSLVSKKFASSSPGRRAARAPLRQTKSASFEPPAPKTKDPIRRTGSEETRSRTRPWVVEQHNEDANRTEEHGPDDTALPPDQPAPEAAALLAVESLNARNRTLTEAAGGGVGPSLARQRPAGGGGSEGCLSAVKWDECEVVDAVLIGDAIETFLKVSMSGPEKRVSFRRNSLDKKAKSDG